jgi:E3 ubiquitin-protein ligase EL5
MAVTGTSLAAAATMLAAAAAIFITFVICLYLFLCAKRYRGAALTISGDRAQPRYVFAGGAGCHGGLDEAAIAALPRDYHLLSQKRSLAKLQLSQYHPVSSS